MVVLQPVLDVPETVFIIVVILADLAVVEAVLPVAADRVQLIATPNQKAIRVVSVTVVQDALDAQQTTISKAFEDVAVEVSNIKNDLATKANINPDVATIEFHTTEEWKAFNSTISTKNKFYIYTDHRENSPGVKVGDGTAYVGDLPFIDTQLDVHMADTVSHITAEERNKWNTAITIRNDPDEETLSFKYV